MFLPRGRVLGFSFRKKRVQAIRVGFRVKFFVGGSGFFLGFSFRNIGFEVFNGFGFKTQRSGGA